MAVNSNLKTQVAALTNRMNGLAGNATAEELVYLSKAAETLGASATIFDVIDYADDKVKEITDTAAAKKTDLTTTGDAQNTRVVTQGDTQVTRVGTAGDAEVARINGAYSILDASGATRVDYGTGTTYTALASIRTRIELYADDTTPFRTLSFTLFNPTIVTDPPFPVRYTIRNRSYQNVSLKSNAGTLLVTIPPFGVAEFWRTRTAWTNAQVFGFRGLTGRPSPLPTNYNPMFQINYGYNSNVSSSVYPLSVKDWGSAVELDGNGDPQRLWQFGRSYNSTSANSSNTYCLGHNYLSLPIGSNNSIFYAGTYTINGHITNASGANVANAIPIAWGWALKFGMIFCFRDSSTGTYRTWRTMAGSPTNYMNEVDATTAGAYDSVYAVQFNEDRILFVFRNTSTNNIRVVGYRSESAGAGITRMGEATVSSGQFVKISHSEFVLSTSTMAVVYDLYANNTMNPTAVISTHPLGSASGIGLYWGNNTFVTGTGQFTWNGASFTKINATTFVVPASTNNQGNLMELAPGLVYFPVRSATAAQPANGQFYYYPGVNSVNSYADTSPDLPHTGFYDALVPYRGRLLHFLNVEPSPATSSAYSRITEVELGYRDNLGNVFKEAM